MPVTDDLLDVLCCPVDRLPLRRMTAEELRDLNDAIAEGRAADGDGARVDTPVESGLATAHGAAFYPVEGGVPVLLAARRIRTRSTPLAEADTRRPPAPGGRPEFPWDRIASQWCTRKPPARPSPQDAALMQRLVGEALAGRDAPRALLLGVTPEIATMRWPSGTRLLAIDSSAAMIRQVWPARAVPDAAVVHGDWASMPIRGAAFDIVVGDASLGFQTYPEPFFGVVGEVRRVLRDGGFLATRVYTRPETREPIDAIFDDLRAGRIGTTQFLWWRLYAALHGERTEGARSTAVWDALAARVPDPAGLYRSLGWPPEDLRATEGLLSFPRTLVFPTLREYRDDLAGEFEEVACESPDFEDGDRNPTTVFRARPR